MKQKEQEWISSNCATIPQAAKPSLHLNNAGAALMPRPVYEAQVAHLTREYATGGYEAKDEAAERIAAVYQSVATLLNAKPQEIAIIENATRAFDMGFHAIPFQPGDIILTSVAEYASNYLAYLRAAETHGVVVRVVPDDEHGQLDTTALEQLLAEPGRGQRVPAGIGVAHPDAFRAGAAGGGDRGAGTKTRRALFSRRHTIGGATAARRGRDRLRSPLLHRAQISARAARSRLSLRARGGPAGVTPAVHRSPRRDLDRTRYLRTAGRRPPLRELGGEFRGDARPGRGGRLCADAGDRTDLVADRHAGQHPARQTRRHPRRRHARSRRDPLRDRRLQHRRTAPGGGPPRPARATRSSRQAGPAHARSMYPRPRRGASRWTRRIAPIQRVGASLGPLLQHQCRAR